MKTRTFDGFGDCPTELHQQRAPRQAALTAAIIASKRVIARGEMDNTRSLGVRLVDLARAPPHGRRALASRAPRGAEPQSRARPAAHRAPAKLPDAEQRNPCSSSSMASATPTGPPSRGAHRHRSQCATRAESPRAYEASAPQPSKTHSKCSPAVTIQSTHCSTIASDSDARCV